MVVWLGSRDRVVLPADFLPRQLWYCARLRPLGGADNVNPSDPGVYFADNANTPALIKIGPIAVGTTQPNASPTGNLGLCKGESWLDTTSTNIFKIHDGTNFRVVNAVASTTSSGFPSSPVDGQLHFVKSTAKLHIYNGTTSAWVQLN